MIEPPCRLRPHTEQISLTHWRKPQGMIEPAVDQQYGPLVFAPWTSLCPGRVVPSAFETLLDKLGYFVSYFKNAHNAGGKPGGRAISCR